MVPLKLSLKIFGKKANERKIYSCFEGCTFSMKLPKKPVIQKHMKNICKFIKN
jgi:hypothetical protein